MKTIMPTIHKIPTMKLANLLMRVESKIADKTKRKEETSVRMAVTPDLRKKRKARFSKTSTRATPSWTSCNQEMKESNQRLAELMSPEMKIMAFQMRTTMLSNLFKTCIFQTEYPSHPTDDYQHNLTLISHSFIIFWHSPLELSQTVNKVNSFWCSIEDGMEAFFEDWMSTLT